MPTSNLLEIQLQHDKWATQQIILACEKLTPDQFAKKFEIGPGSLQATVTHMISAIRAWINTLAEQPQSPRIDQSGIQYSPAQLTPMFEESANEFAALAKKYPLDQLVKRERQGKIYSFTRGVVITHVTTHGMHHRAQCLNMLKHLGVTPLPPTSVVEWSRMADLPQ